MRRPPVGTSAACWCERRFRHVPFQGRSRIDYIICSRVRKENRPRAGKSTTFPNCATAAPHRLTPRMNRPDGYRGAATLTKSRQAGAHRSRMRPPLTVRGSASCCPLYPRKRTSSTHVGMSALCQKRPNALQQNASLFDHLVGAGLAMAAPQGQA